MGATIATTLWRASPNGMKAKQQKSLRLWSLILKTQSLRSENSQEKPYLDWCITMTQSLALDMWIHLADIHSEADIYIYNIEAEDLRVIAAPSHWMT